MIFISFSAVASSTSWVLRDERHLGRVVVETGLLNRGPHQNRVGRIADDLERVAEVVDLLGIGVQGRLQDVVLGELRPSCSLATVTTPLRLNIRAVEPASAIVPPLRVTATRTSEAERLRLSVRHSISSAMPAGPYASYISVS